MDDNILERVPGQYVAAALITLPPAERSTKDTTEAFIDVPGIGRVRITASRHRSKKGKVSHYFWTAERAVLAKPASMSAAMLKPSPERRKKWSFYILADGRWVWRVLHPDLSEACASSSFDNFDECSTDALRHGYVPVSAAHERRRRTSE